MIKEMKNETGETIGNYSLNNKYFPDLSEDVLKWLKDAHEYLTGELSHKYENEEFTVKLEVPKGLKFAPRMNGDEVVSYDIVRNND